MKNFLIFLCLLFLSTNLLCQTLSVGYSEFCFNSPTPDIILDDYEFDPNENGYGMYSNYSFSFTLDDFKFFDNKESILFFSDKGYKKFSALRAGIRYKPIVFSLNDKPLFGCWLVLSISSFSNNWINFIINEEEKALEIQLGYPPKSFKYHSKEFNNPIEKDFLKFFIYNNKIKTD